MKDFDDVVKKTCEDFETSEGREIMKAWDKVEKFMMQECGRFKDIDPKAFEETCEGLYGFRNTIKELIKNKELYKHIANNNEKEDDDQGFMA